MNGKNIPNYYYDNLMDTIVQYEKMGLENPSLLIPTMTTQGKRYMDQIRIVVTLINRDWNEKSSKYVRGFMIGSYPRRRTSK